MFITSERPIFRCRVTDSQYGLVRRAVGYRCRKTISGPCLGAAKALAGTVACHPGLCGQCDAVYCHPYWHISATGDGYCPGAKDAMNWSGDASQPSGDGRADGQVGPERVASEVRCVQLVPEPIRRVARERAP
jgi:hypothetical protein